MYLMKRFSTMLLMLLLFIGVSTNAQDLVITGVYDGPRSGGTPKGVELYVINNIADLSGYGLGSANNGGGSDGEEFTFPADAATAGDFIYVATEDVEFPIWFGFAPNYTDASMSINGDDAIELFMNGNVIDVFGDIDVDGTGEPWEHLDGWAYRNDGTGPDGSTFVVGNFSYSGIDVWDNDGANTNATSASPFPTGTYTAGAPTSVSTPIISPGSGDYTDPVDVIMTCGTAGASIYYTTDGTDPDESDDQYTASFQISVNTTVKARAYKAGLDPSNIAIVVYNFPTTTTIANIASLRTQTAGGADIYELTGEAILTYQQSYRGIKYIEDATAGILIDDDAGNISTTYDVNDGITGITGQLLEYGGMLQFIPISDPGAATSTGNSITPQVVTLAQLTTNFEDYEAELVKVESATFSDAGTDFANGTVYVITDGSKSTYNFRTSFYDVDYIGTAIPSGPQDLVMLPNSRTDGEFSTSRSAADISSASSANPATKLDITSINGGSPVYENQAFTVTVQAQDVNGVAANVDADINVTLSVGTGSGAIGGTITGTIANGTNTLTITGTTYGPHENGVVLNAAGSPLTTGNSDPFNVLEVVVPEIVITEVMYNALPGSDDPLEYIELYNSGATINLEGYEFTSGIELIFSSVTFGAGEYLLVSRDATVVQSVLGASSIQWTGNNLSNGGELIELSDNLGNIVTAVEYSDESPWPAGERGKSIRFCDINQAQNVGENWSNSVEFIITHEGQDIYGTPLADCGAAALIADFEADETDIMVGDNVNFTDLSSGDPTSWEWTFSGGTPSTSDVQNPTNIVYNTAGDYDVTLTIHLGGDSDVETKVAYISVSDPTVAPVANFEADQTTILVGQVIQFTDLSQNAPTDWTWTFDGGTPASSNDQNPSITYNTAGTFDVTLFVENSAGDDELIMTNYITVLPADVGDLVITEIMYNPPEAGDDSLEFVEIFNNSDANVNLMAYEFTSGVDYVFPDVDLSSGNYFVIAKDSLAIMDIFGITSYQWDDGSLSNGGETLLLVSPAGITVDSVPFSDTTPWPEEADGSGPSITICDSETENSIGENWHASVHFLAVNANNDSIYGSPGMAPAPVADFVADVTSFPGSGGQVEFSELATCNADTYSWEFEGGSPATSSDPDPIITYNTAGDYDVSLTVTNSTGNHTFTMEEYIHVGVGVAEQVFEQISIFPNPSNGYFKLSNPNQEQMNIAVYSILGELITEISNNEKYYSLDLANEQNGIYLLQIIIDGETKTIRIIKQ